MTTAAQGSVCGLIYEAEMIEKVLVGASVAVIAVGPAAPAGANPVQKHHSVQDFLAAVQAEGLEWNRSVWVQDTGAGDLSSERLSGTGNNLLDRHNLNRPPGQHDHMLIGRNEFGAHHMIKVFADELGIAFG